MMNYFLLSGFANSDYQNLLGFSATILYTGCSKLILRSWRKSNDTLFVERNIEFTY